MSYQQLPPLIDHRQQSISALAFDPVSDALWAGTALGSVAAQYPTNARGIQYPATTQGHPVLKLSASEKDVKAVTESGMGAWGKGGVNKWYYP